MSTFTTADQYEADAIKRLKTEDFRKVADLKTRYLMAVHWSADRGGETPPHSADLPGLAEFIAKRLAADEIEDDAERKAVKKLLVVRYWETAERLTLGDPGEKQKQEN